MNLNFICRQNKALVRDLSKPTFDSIDLYFPTKYAQPTYGQFKLCLWKHWWTYWRSPDYNYERLFFTFVTALLLGAIFWQLAHKKYVYLLYLSYNRLLKHVKLEHFFKLTVV